MWLLIDDVRDVPVDVIARNFAAGKFMLMTGMLWEGIVFDNDLASEKAGEDGADLLDWAIQTRNLRTNLVQIVSSNPVGVKRMQEMLLHAGFTQINPREFRRYGE